MSDTTMQKIQLDRLKDRRERINSGKAALEGFGEASTLGYLPQLQAAASPILKPIYEAATGPHSQGTIRFE